MARVQTTNYGSTTDTQFRWATTDDDLFDREFDVYRLSQAVELHDHSATKGLPVARLANNVVTDVNIAALSVTTTKLADAAVTTVKIADAAVTTAKIADANVTDGKMQNQKVNRVGDTMTGDLKITRAAAPTTGYLVLGTDTANFIGFDGTQMRITGNNIIWHSGNDGVGSALDAGLLGGQLPAFYASAAAVVPFPLLGVCWFQVTAHLTGAGAKFARFTAADGRLLMAAGTTFGQTFAENTPYGGSWTPTAGVGVSSTLGVSAIGGTTESNLLVPTSGGTTGVATHEHTHPAPTLTGSVAISGTGTVWHVPAWAGLWGQRTS